MTDFLLELLTEEIPARMQARAIEQLIERFTAGAAAAALPVGAVTGAVTPRRLVLIVRDVAAASAGTSDERRGPRTDAPDQAIAGFIKSTGIARDAMEERDTPKGRFLYATIATPGRNAADIIAALIPAIIRDFDWPKSMRWGYASASTASPRWVRPLSGIVAMLDDAVVPFEAAGIASGRTTFGHRFLSSGGIEIASAATYADQLRAAHVMLDAGERRAVIVSGAQAAASAEGLTLIPDDGLVAENAGLTEWPVPLLGRFDPAFLDVPREVIQLTMRTNQKYFACTEADGALAAAFVCVANIAADDGGAAIVAGNEKVLAARLADAKFFWDADRGVTLESRLPKLADIVFHEKLGTVADKVERMAKLARWLVESGAVTPADPPRSRGGGAPLRDGGGVARTQPASLLAPPSTMQEHGPPPRSGEDQAALATLAETAARLCKADLVSATVGEFPEVQGIAGGHLALAQGLDPQIAAAIRDHYKPVGPSDEVPTAPVTVAVALADKLDTLIAMFAVGEKPTGSRDPFALRRAGLGIVAMILKAELRCSITRIAKRADLPFAEMQDGSRTSFREVVDFIIDRLKVQQREAGIRPDVIDAVFALGGENDLVRLVARAKALQAVLLTPDGASLLAGYKRGANMLRIEEVKDGIIEGEVEAERLTEPAEMALNAALDAAEPTVAMAVAEERFEAAMTALARLRPAVDAFFTHVTVNAADQEIRRNRLALLARLRTAVHSVADFSKLEG